MSRRLRELVTRHGLPEGAQVPLRCLFELLVEDPHAPTALRDPARVLDDHLADSLVSLELEALRLARTVADIGSGAGLPGLPIAAAMPQCRFSLVESSERRAAFIAFAVARCQLPNVEVIHARAESWREGRGEFEIVTARALASSPVVLEYAAPLLAIGGRLIAWRGRRDAVDEAAATKAASELGLQLEEVRRVQPYPEAQHRFLHVWLKVTATPARFPRRPGVAVRRPLGTRPRPSDRHRR